MKLIDITENVVKFEKPEDKQKRLKKEQQLKRLKSIDHKEVQHKLDVLANRSKIQPVD